MSGARNRKLKFIFAEIAKKFDVGRSRVWISARRAIAGLKWGHTWHTRLYATRPITPDEADAFHLPRNATVLTAKGRNPRRLILYPATYKDQNHEVHVTVCAAAYSQLKDLSLRRIEPKEDD